MTRDEQYINLLVAYTRDLSDVISMESKTRREVREMLDKVQKTARNI